MWPSGSTIARPRRGSILLVAMVCTLVMLSIFAAMLQMARVTRIQVRREALRSQARWLAEAGASRAAASLAVTDGYTGETWNVPAAELHENPGRVTIVVTPSTIDVVAEYPADAPDRVRVEKSWPLKEQIRNPS